MKSLIKFLNMLKEIIIVSFS